LHWTNTYLALIVPNLTSIFGIFLMRQFMMTIPMSYWMQPELMVATNSVYSAR
jgi:ABC-type glycerol-3-phosphate transport system permease component